MNHLRVFRCLCYVHSQKHGGDKFSTHSNRYVFLGYPFAKKGWRVYNLDTGIIFVSRDVIFSETNFPFATLELSSSISPSAHVSPTLLINDDDFPDSVPITFDSSLSHDYAPVVSQLPTTANDFAANDSSNQSTFASSQELSHEVSLPAV